MAGHQAYMAKSNVQFTKDSDEITRQMGSRINS